MSDPTAAEVLIGVNARKARTRAQQDQPLALPGTVQSYTDGVAQVDIDGDLGTGARAARSQIGPLVAGDRVMVQFRPPRGVFVIERYAGFSPAIDTAAVATTESTASSSYTDLATVGPAVSMNTMTRALVTVSCTMAALGAAESGFMTFAVSGASTVAAASSRALELGGAGGTNTVWKASCVILLTGLVPGINVFTAKYRVALGSNVDFASRTIIVQSFPEP